MSSSAESNATLTQVDPSRKNEQRSISEGTAAKDVVFSGNYFLYPGERARIQRLSKRFDNSTLYLHRTESKERKLRSSCSDCL